MSGKRKSIFCEKKCGAACVVLFLGIIYAKRVRAFF